MALNRPVTSGQTGMAALPAKGGGATTTVAFTTTAGTTAAIDVPGLDAGTPIIVRVVVTSAAYVRFGGTATSAYMYMPAEVPEYFTMKENDTVSAIQVAAGGNLHVTVMQGGE